jgi:hypothetical protein
MRRKRRERRDDIIVPSMDDNQTWNDCPACGKSWKDAIATPGLIHRTRLCSECAEKIKHNAHNSHANAVQSIRW